MLRKLVVVLLAGVICLLGIIPVLAEHAIPYSTLTDYEKLTGKKIVKFNEAPILRTMVATGELPPVEKRLPEEPMVIKPVEEIGEYGGTWHRAWMGLGDKFGPSKLMSETLLKFSWNGKEILPNFAKSWEISEGGKVYTFHFRKGVKWSDGKPFSADDMLFYWEDVLLNKELTPVFPKWLIMGGKRAEFEKIDDYTVRFRFAEPYGLFLSLSVSYSLYEPKHYAMQFLPRYTSADKLKKMVKEAGFDYWYQLYQNKMASGWWDTNPDRPTLRAWKLEVPGTATRMVHVRNPYYWKVDTEGNQLPYIDRVTHDLVETSGMINFKAMTGEIDMQMRHIVFTNYTLLMENREKGDYRVLKWKEAIGANPLIQLNQNCKDLVLRKLFQNDKFRKALSLAIKRDEINELCYMGMAEPRQASIVSGGAYYSEDWEKAYAEYDPEKANAFLDEIGLTKRDAAGFRLRDDGKTLSVLIEFTPVLGSWVDACELIKEYWETIGIKVAIKSMERSLRTTRRNANEHQIAIWCMDRCANWPVAPPAHMIWGKEGWGKRYSDWYLSDGKTGEKPTGDIAKLYELWDKMKAAPSKKELDRLAKEVTNLHKKNIWMIGTVGETIQPVVVKNNFRNVPAELISDNPLKTPGNAETAQFFIKQK